MEHLPVHLAEEAFLAGAVQFRWMYPIERYLCTLKRYVRNRAHPEASIANGYIMEECMNFATRYLDNVETKSNRTTRNCDGGNKEGRASNKGRKKVLDRVTWTQCHCYVLNNIDVVKPFIDMHMCELSSKFPRSRYHEIQSLHNNTFHTWFKSHMIMNRKKRKGISMMEKLASESSTTRSCTGAQSRPTILEIDQVQQQANPTPLALDMVQPQTSDSTIAVDRGQQLKTSSAFLVGQIQQQAPFIAGVVNQVHQQNITVTTPPDMEHNANLDNTPTMQTIINAGGTSNIVPRKRGRGPAKDDDLGNGKKLVLEFNDNFQVIGPNTSKYGSLLGRIARNGVQVPLTYIEWPSMPEHVLNYIWREVQEKTNAPLEHKSICLLSVGDKWRKWKSRIKKNYFNGKTDEQLLENVPDRVDPKQWETLISYWRTEKFQTISKQNSINRELAGPRPRTGRTSMAEFTAKLATAGKPTDRLSVYIESRCKDGVPADPDAANIIEQMQERLSNVPVEEQTTKLRNEVFDSIMVKESHGYVPTMGLGVTTNILSQSKKRTEYSDKDFKIMCEKVEAEIMKKMTPIMCEKVEAEIVKKMTPILNRMQDHINVLESKYENGAGSPPLSDTINEKALEKSTSYVQQLERQRDAGKTKEAQFYLRDEEDSEDEDEDY